MVLDLSSNELYTFELDYNIDFIRMERYWFGWDKEANGF
jgi:hypothetical protein